MADDGWAPWETQPRRSSGARTPVADPGASSTATPAAPETTAGDRTAAAGDPRTAAGDPKAAPGAPAPTPRGSSATAVSSGPPLSRPSATSAPGTRKPPATVSLEIESSRVGRTPLSRLAIVAAALGVIDADGLEALNMRRLGQELGVGAMAVYRHVRDKDQLLDLIIEGVLRESPRPELTGDWREDASRIARATRAGLMRHRRAVGLLASRPWVGPAGLEGIDVTLGVFRKAGLDDRRAAFAQFALGNFVEGFCAWESANLGAASEDPGARAQVLAAFQATAAALPRDRFPNLVDLAPEIVAGSLDDRFEFGLRALLDGIEASARPVAG